MSEQDKDKKDEPVDHNAEQTDGGKDPGTSENAEGQEKLDESREGADGEGLDEDAPARTPAEAAAQGKEFKDEPGELSTTIEDPVSAAASTAIGEASGAKEEKDDNGNARVVADPEAKVVNGE